MPFTGARVYNNAAASVPNKGSGATLAFNAVRFDTDAFFDPAHPERLTVPTGLGGMYLVGANVSFAPNGAGVRDVAIAKTDAATQTELSIADASHPAASGISTSVAVVTLVELAEGDFLEVYVYQSSGAALNITSVAEYTPEFWLTKVG